MFKQVSRRFGCLLPLIVAEIIVIAWIFRKYWYSLIVLGGAIAYMLFMLIKSIGANTNHIAGEMSAKREQRLFDGRAKQLRLGMSEEELIRIMGEPLSKQLISTEEMDEEIKKKHKELWSYDYIAGSHIWRVFIDPQKWIIVHIHQSRIIMD